MSDSVIVTGANRGIGLEVCRQLARRGRRVVLCARDAERGARAARSLADEAGEVVSAVLDVADPASTAAFASGAGVARAVAALVHNAGIALDGFDAEVVRRTLEVNFRGVVRLTDALEDRLVPGARVVMVSSGLGELSLVGPSLRRRFADPALDRARLSALADEFEAAVVAGRHRAEGWPSSAYGVSKLCLNAFVRVLDRERGAELRVNAVCPGWVRTDMGGRSAPRGVEEGADSVVWAALELETGGGFYRDRAPIPW